MSWNTVKSIIGKAAPILGSLVGGPLGGAVGGLIGSALGVDGNDADAVALSLQNDPNALIKLKELEATHIEKLTELQMEAAKYEMIEKTKQIQAINETMRAETVAQDKFRGRWRPLFGYLVGIGWFLQCITISFCCLFVLMAHPEILPNVPALIGALTAEWAIPLGVLGVNIHQRTKSKLMEGGMVSPDGVLSKIVNGIKKDGNKQ